MRKATTSPFLTLILLLFTANLLTPSPGQAQQMVFQSADDGSMAIMAIPGGMIIVEGQEEARVRRSIIPGQSGAEKVDIQEGDLIIFFNGTRIKSTNQLNELYEKIEIGAEIKLGIQRGENKAIRSFEKPELQDNYSSSDGSGSRVMSFSTTGSPGGELMASLENPGMWPAGFLVGEKDGEVVIGGLIPFPNKAAALSDIKEGDVIASLDGTAVTSVSQLNKTYENIPVGDDVTLEVRNEAGTEKVMFKKPEPPQMRMQVRTN